MIQRDVSWRVEDACLKAFPALHQVVLGEWLLRFSDGMSRRANSVNPLAPACAGIDAMIETAEPLYRDHGLPTIFRVPAIVDPRLDRTLADRGYGSEGETGVLHCPIDALAAAEDARIALPASPDAAWLTAMAKLQGHTPTQRAAYGRIVEAIAVPARFALLAIDGVPAALAFGALYEGMLCYESVIVAPERRRHGLARRVMAALAGWARAAGADAACLQVAADNAAARPLYASLGFHELYRYHYRRKPEPARRSPALQP